MASHRDHHAPVKPKYPHESSLVARIPNPKQTEQPDNEPQDNQKLSLLLVKPPKDIDEMSDEELDAFAEAIWQGLKGTGK